MCCQLLILLCAFRQMLSPLPRSILTVGKLIDWGDQTLTTPVWVTQRYVKNSCACETKAINCSTISEVK